MYSKYKFTGKRTFNSVQEARFILYRLRIPLWNRLTGIRIKHRQGKPAQKRVYLCPYCNGYHLTKWSLGQYLKVKHRK